MPPTPPHDTIITAAAWLVAAGMFACFGIFYLLREILNDRSIAQAQGEQRLLLAWKDSDERLMDYAKASEDRFVEAWSASDSRLDEAWRAIAVRTPPQAPEAESPSNAQGGGAAPPSGIPVLVIEVEKRRSPPSPN